MDDAFFGRVKRLMDRLDGELRQELGEIVMDAVSLGLKEARSAIEDPAVIQHLQKAMGFQKCSNPKCPNPWFYPKRKGQHACGRDACRVATGRARNQSKA